MSRIREQGGLDCWAAAACGVAEGLLQHYLGYVAPDSGIMLDDMFIYNNISYQNVSTGLHFLASHKCPSLPYKNNGPNYDHAYYTISSYTDRYPAIDTIQNALLSSPVEAEMNVYEDLVTYTGGIYRHTPGSPWVGGHSVVIIGYDNDNQCWICRNSWGTTFGETEPGNHFQETGYFRIAYGECEIDSYGNDYGAVTSNLCLAKIIPDFKTIDAAMNNSFANNEYAYVKANTSTSANFTIPSGTTIQFETGASLTTTGTLTINGTSTQPVIFEPITGRGNQPGTWGTITLNGSGTSNSNLNYVTVNYGSGIQCLNGSNATIQNSHIYYCTNGVYIYNSSPNILSNNISMPLQNGIYGQGSGMAPRILNNIMTDSPDGYETDGLYFFNYMNPFIAHNDISGFYVGTSIGGSSLARFTDSYGYPTFNPNNRIRNNYDGLIACNGSYIYGGTYYGYNSCYGNSDLDVKSSYSSNLLAVNNYWGGGEPKSYHDGTSYLTIDPVISSPDPWAGNPSIRQYNNSKTNEITSSLPVTVTDSSWIYLNKGMSFEENGNNDAAIDVYKMMINKSISPEIAFSQLYKICNQYSRNDILTYFGSFSAASKYNSVVSKLIADYNLKSGQFDNAITTYDNLSKNYPNDFIGINARFEKLFAYINLKNDKTTAQNVLSQIKALNLTEPTWAVQIQMAENLLGNSSSVVNNSINSTPSSLYSLSNYPNPFNPSTVINYAIPKDGIVTIKVYDILGREIKTLVNDFRTQGKYSVSFNATNLSSGIYFYQLRSGSFISTKKMIFTK